MTTPREAAYLAVLASVREERFVSDSLNDWKLKDHPTSRDFNFAQEIAYGTTRMALALDYIAASLTEKLKLGLKERVLLRTAIYQNYYMDRVPLYAITNETQVIAKKYFHSSFVKFLNAILRKLADTQPELPNDWSIRYSYPPFFISTLIQDYGKETAESILKLGNQPAPIMFRNRKTNEVEVLSDIEKFSEIILSNQYYIQNETPVKLIQKLAQNHSPKKILDLCASPGGKLLAIHDQFPTAELHANDVSEEKLKTLKENCEKYQLKASLTLSKGEDFKSEELFDLIILDVPCSNTGVLNKRPEARFRLNEKNLGFLEETQLKIIQNAINLLAPKGEIWFMTCSILKRENEHLMEKASKRFDLQIKSSQTILPSENGADGGFACALASTN